MAIVTGPLAEGGHLDEADDGKEGYAAVYRVTALTGTGQQMLRTALATAGIPRRGDRHPNRTTAYVTGRHAVGEGGGQVRVTITYTDRGNSDEPESQRIRIGTSLRTVQTSRDVKGNAVRLSCPGKKDQGGSMSVERPVSTIQVSRTEAESPGAKSQEYVGTVNGRGQFRLAAGGAIPRTWRCNSITGESSDGGVSWRTEYEFEYDKYSWDQEIVYIDPETGCVPDELLDVFEIDPWGAVAREGWRYVQVYEEKNFNNLRLI